jgi:hypothetical protein
MTWAQRLPGNVKFDTWRQLVLPRFTYAKQIASFYSKHVAESLKSFYYRSIKCLLKVKMKVNKDQMLTLVLGRKYEEYSEATTTVAQLQGTDMDPDKRKTFDNSILTMQYSMATLKQWTQV